jgi:hypothetical protein
MSRRQFLRYSAITVAMTSALAADEFLEKPYESNKYQEDGYILMANQIQPALLAALTPGYGETHKYVLVRFSQQVQPLSLV